MSPIPNCSQCRRMLQLKWILGPGNPFGDANPADGVDPDGRPAQVLCGSAHTCPQKASGRGEEEVQFKSCGGIFWNILRWQHVLRTGELWEVRGWRLARRRRRTWQRRPSWRGRRQRRGRILSLDTICAAVLAPRTTHDPSSWESNIWRIEAACDIFFTILKPLVLVMWSSFKILIGSRAHVLNELSHDW